MGEKVHYESKLLILPKIWECRKASFAFNASKLFNELPRNLRDFTQRSIKSLKNKLDAFLNRVPDEPQLVGLTIKKSCIKFNYRNGAMDCCWRKSHFQSQLD